jgi:hypothetical protein
MIKRNYKNKNILKLPASVLHNLKNDSFLRILKFIPFYISFSKFASLNKETRRLVMNSYEAVCKERTMTVDLSKSTKKLKKTPRYIVKRLNYIIVIMRQDARMERIDRLLEFFRPHRGRLRMMLNMLGMDDSDVNIRAKMKRFKDIPIQRLALKKCNLQEKNTQLMIF